MHWSPKVLLPLPAFLIALHPTPTGYYAATDTLPFFARARVEAKVADPGVPVRVVIEKIGVDAALEQMGIGPDGKLDAPKERLNAGWYTGGARPGERGTAVIDGHLDLAGQPGVFWRLNEVRPGDTIAVTDAEGVTRRFSVDTAHVYDVQTAPLHEIFGQSQDERLHLITCAGTWDTSLGHYDKRLVIYAKLQTDSAVAS